MEKYDSTGGLAEVQDDAHTGVHKTLTMKNPVTLRTTNTDTCALFVDHTDTYKPCRHI